MESISTSVLSNLIGDIYDCALDAALWPQTLEEITKLFEAEVTAIFAIEPMAHRIVFAHVHGEDPAQTAAEGAQFGAINPFMTIAWHSELCEPHSLRSFMDPDELRRTRFYKEFMAQKGWFDFVGAALQKSARRYTSISVPRREERGEAGPREMELMRLIAPHLRRALTIQDTLDAKDARISALSGALDLAATPIMLLDARGALTEANRAAERFLAEERAAKIEQGRLRFCDAEVAARVEGAVDAAARGGCASAMTLALRAPSGRAYAMELLPLSSPARRLSAGRAVVALFLQAVGAQEPLPGEVLVKLYGLTPAETRLLVLLAQNMTLREAAETLGVREATVKTQMQHIFVKTGASRQAEAIKLAMSALPRPPAPEG